jgi:hypothetical protein
MRGMRQAQQREYWRVPTLSVPSSSPPSPLMWSKASTHTPHAHTRTHHTPRQKPNMLHNSHDKCHVLPRLHHGPPTRTTSARTRSTGTSRMMSSAARALATWWSPTLPTPPTRASSPSLQSSALRSQTCKLCATKITWSTDVFWLQALGPRLTEPNRNITIRHCNLHPASKVVISMNPHSVVV